MSALRGTAVRHLQLALVATAACAGCRDAGRREAEGVELRALAAASLTDVLPQLAAAWSETSGDRVRWSFGATSRLARQLQAGAPTDLFFSADQRWMDHLTKRQLVIPETRVDVAENRLVAISPAEGALSIAGPGELRSSCPERVAVAGEAVPAGRYAREALRSAGVWDTVAPRVVDGHSVRTVLGWVAHGEMPLGVVYATDARVEPRVQVLFTFAEGSHTRIVYPAAVASSSTRRADAEAFLGFLQSETAHRILAEAGFSPPGPQS